MHDFLMAWELFAATWLAGALIAMLLALVGVWVVAREQIFLGAAVGEASALGIAAGLWLGGTAALHRVIEHGLPEPALAGLSVAAATAATLATGMNPRGHRESAETVTGWLFLLGMSGSVLLVAANPHGSHRVQQLITSTLIGATMPDVWIFAGWLAAVAVATAVHWRKLVLLALDAETAAALGLRVGRWHFGVCLVLGLSVGLAMRVSGLLFTFGCLILPALAARQIFRRTATVLLAAPLLALGTAAAGFALAHHRDLPPAQVTVFLLAILLPLARGTRAAIHTVIGHP